MKQTYNKLVRDKIPEIIRQKKEIPFTAILDDEAYADCLYSKLGEEYQEFLASAKNTPVHKRLCRGTGRHARSHADHL